MTDQLEAFPPEELADLLRRSSARGQIAWLDANGWVYHLDGSQRPIVGRWYARMKLAGITPQAASAEVWAPDFTGIR